MLQDIRYGIRMLLKKPGFTAVAVLSLALGIGANTAIFSLLDAVLLKTLSVERPDQLVLFGKAESMGMTTGFPDGSTDLYSYPFYRQVQQQRTDVFSGVASLLSLQWNVHGFVNTSGDIEQLQVQLVSGSYFPVLGVNAGLGRVLTEADDQNPGAHRGLSNLREQFSLSLKVLMGVVALVLLIASANVANLLLAHGAARSREFAVRLAVGAGRMRLARQLLTESALLALLGGAIGVALSWWGVRLLLLMASDGPEALPVDAAPNLRVLGFTIGVSAVCAIVFGTAPALRASRIEPNTSLKGGKTLNALRNPLGKAFVVAQVALSLLLLVGAGLFVRTLVNLQKIPSGFKQENAMLFMIDTSATGMKTDDPKLPPLLSEVEDKVKQVPGVQAASFAFIVFNQGFWTGAAYTREDNIPEGQNRSLRNNMVGPDFFAAMGIPFVQGRGFGPQDTKSSQKVAVVTESMVQKFFPTGNPIGKRFGIEGRESAETIEVIGVVKDAKYGSLKEPFRPMAFYPYTQVPDVLGNLVVRFSGPASAVVPQIRETEILSTMGTWFTYQYGLELKPNDPLTIVLATMVLMAVALLAGFLPARRASRVDPMIALRDE